MAKKKKNARPSADARANDMITYKILGAFLVATVCVFAMMTISSHYQIGSEFLKVNEGLMTAGIVAGLVALLGFLFLLIDRFVANKPIRIIGTILLPTGLLVWLSCLAMYYFYLNAITILCFFYPAAAVLYLIYLIYQPEFFMLATDSVICGFGFYLLSKLISTGPLSYIGILIVAGMVVMNLAVLFLSIYAGKNGGKLKFNTKTVNLHAFQLSGKLHLATVALYILGVVLSLIIGPLCAYIFLFVTLAYLFILAVYYTLKLM